MNMVRTTISLLLGPQRSASGLILSPGHILKQAFSIVAYEPESLTPPHLC